MTLRLGMILAPTPREAGAVVLLLAQGLTAAATALRWSGTPTLSGVGRRPSVREGLRP